MNRIELENRLKTEGLTTIYDNGRKKQYIDGDKLYTNEVFNNCPNVYGIYKGKNNKFVMFFTDDERGISYLTKTFDTEYDACDFIYNFVMRLNRIYNKTKASKNNDFGLF